MSQICSLPGFPCAHTIGRVGAIGTCRSCCSSWSPFSSKSIFCKHGSGAVGWKWKSGSLWPSCATLLRMELARYRTRFDGVRELPVFVGCSTHLGQICFKTEIRGWESPWLKCYMCPLSLLKSSRFSQTNDSEFIGRFPESLNSCF